MVNNTIENNDTATEEGGETITKYWCNTCGTTFELDYTHCPACFSKDAFEQEFVKGDSQ